MIEALDDVLDVRLAMEPTSLVPLVDTSRACADVVLHQVLETLIHRSADPGRFVSELASDFEISEDRLTYFFHLDPAAAWSDERPVLAGDVVHTLRRLLDPAEVLLPRLAELGVSHVEASDERTVVVHLLAPSEVLLLTLSQIPILPRHVFERTEVSSAPQARRPLGSGPYTVERWVSGQRIVLRRNPRWRGAAPAFETVVYHVVPDDQIAISLFNAGNLDVVGGLQRRPSHSSRGRFRQYVLPEFVALVYNAGRAATRDPAVRRAIGRLVDRVTLRCEVLDCLAVPLGASFPRLTTPLDLLNRSFDPKAAAAGLDAAGWLHSLDDTVRRRAGVRLSLNLLVEHEQSGFGRASALLAEDAAAVGVVLRVERLGKRALQSRLVQRDFDIAAVAIGDELLASPRRFLSHEGPAPWVFGDARDFEVETLVTELGNAKDDLQRRAIREQLSKRLAELEPLSFVYWRQEGMLANRGLAELSIERGRFDASAARPAARGDRP